MKKFCSILLILSMLLGIAACGAAPESSVSSVSASEAVSAPEPAAESPEATPASVQETPEPTPEPVVSVQEPESTPSQERNEVLADDENCTVELVSISPDNAWGYTWNVYLENKTDKTLVFSIDGVSVNGVMCDPFWATTVTAGKKSNEEISWDPDEFERLGITEVTVVEFTLLVYDDEDWTADDLIDTVITVYPQGPDAAYTVQRTPEDSDIVLFDTESCTMIVTGFDPDGFWGYTVNAYLVNKTDQSLIFSIDNASVNDAMCDPFWASSVAPGKVSYETISWSPDDFEINGITTVEQIEMDISVTDEDFTSELISDTFTIEPQPPITDAVGI